MAHNGVSYRMPTKATSGPSVEFQQGCGEGPDIPAMMLTADGVLDLAEEEVSAACAGPDVLLIATCNPPSLLALPWEILETLEVATPKADIYNASAPVALQQLKWLVSRGVLIAKISYSARLDIYTVLTTCGRVYLMQDVRRSYTNANQQMDEGLPRWRGSCVYGSDSSRPTAEMRPFSEVPYHEQQDPGPLNEAIRATEVSVNERLSLLSIGLAK
jgi:hypothetical protein